MTFYAYVPPKQSYESYHLNYFIIYFACRFNSIGTGGFIFADQFLQISSLLPTSNIYGIGEHRSRLKLNTNWQSFTLFNKDQPPTENVRCLILSYANRLSLYK